jgi:hypothetical protein
MNVSIHDILKIRILGDNIGYVKYLSTIFHHFSISDEIKNPDLVIDVSEPILIKNNNDEYYVFNRKYWVKKDYIYWRDQYKIVRWRACLKGVEKNATILQFNAGIFGKVLLLDRLINPLIGFKLVQKNFALLHSSGICIDGLGFIFPAYMGVGKTSTLLNLADQGEFLANEKIILSSNGTVYSFPIPIDIYYYNLQASPSILEKIRLKEKIDLKLKHLIYRFSNRYATFPLEIDPARLWKLGTKCHLKTVFLLLKTNRKHVKIIENCQKEEIIRRIMVISKFDMKDLLEALEAYSFFYPSLDLNSFWKKFQEILSNALKNVSCHIIEIPCQYDPTTFKSIYNLIQSNLKS